MRWLNKESIHDDKEFYHFLNFFFSKIHAVDQFNKMTSLLDESGIYDRDTHPQNIAQTLYSLAMYQMYDSDLWGKLIN